jgi:hypothetical protein
MGDQLTAILIELDPLHHRLIDPEQPSPYPASAHVVSCPAPFPASQLEP